MRFAFISHCYIFSAFSPSKHCSKRNALLVSIQFYCTTKSVFVMPTNFILLKVYWIGGFVTNIFFFPLGDKSICIKHRKDKIITPVWHNYGAVFIGVMVYICFKIQYRGTHSKLRIFADLWKLGEKKKYKINKEFKVNT